MVLKLLLLTFCTIKRAAVYFVEVSESVVVGKSRIVIADRKRRAIMDEIKVDGAFNITR